MNFGGNSTPVIKRRKQDHGGLLSINDSNFEEDLSLYSFPPEGKIDLLEVDEMVEERFSILEVFDEFKIGEMGQIQKLPDFLGTIRERLKQVTSKFGDNFITTLHTRGMGSNNALKKDARNRDQISHFMLRLYFCPVELRPWFVSKEVELLRYRLLEETVDKKNSTLVARLIVNNGLNFEPIKLDNSVKANELKTKASFNSLFVNEDKNPIYRIAFEDALDVVRSRKAYVQDGYAYVTTHDMITLICSKFRQNLNINLSKLVGDRADEENRLVQLVKNVYAMRKASSRKLKTDASGKIKEAITPQMVDGLAVENFPPCMESIHFNLRKNHHIKYGGRLHYSLFLKGIGMTLEDAIKFFRDEFVQKMPPEKFDKEYRYGIRYNYGKEGKKVDFSPYGCEKIINSTPGTGDVHGCPFKHHDTGILRKFLSRKGVADEVLNNIEILLEAKSYSRACTLYFSARHPGHHLTEEGITHPNSFYTESRKAMARNPKREEIMGDEEMDHIIIPDDEFLTQTSVASEETLPTKDSTDEPTNMKECEETINSHEETLDKEENNDAIVSTDVELSQVETELIKNVDDSVDSSKLETIIERIDEDDGDGDKPKEQKETQSAPEQ